MEQVSTAEQHLHRHMQCKASDAVKNTSPLESRAVERVTNNVSLSGVDECTFGDCQNNSKCDEE